MSRIITRTAAAAVAAAAVLSVAGTAQAATPNKADKAAAKVANKVCAPVTDDYSFEACFVGEFAQQTGRILTGSDYEIADNGVKLTGRSHKVAHSAAAKVTAKDRKAVKSAFGQADYGVDRDLDAQWMDTLVGDFILQRGRYVSADWFRFDAKGVAHLTRHSEPTTAAWRQQLAARGYESVAGVEGLADALAEGEGGPSRDWDACMVKFGDTTVVQCPDGKRFVS
jgi:hypothetical protein